MFVQVKMLRWLKLPKQVEKVYRSEMVAIIVKQLDMSVIYSKVVVKTWLSGKTELPPRCNYLYYSIGWSIVFNTRPKNI